MTINVYVNRDSIELDAAEERLYSAAVYDLLAGHYPQATISVTVGAILSRVDVENMETGDAEIIASLVHSVWDRQEFMTV